MCHVSICISSKYFSTNLVWAYVLDIDGFYMHFAYVIFETRFSYNDNSHYTKKYISQVLEYHENLKKTNIYHLSINFLAQKKNYILHLQKVQNKDFPIISKYHLSNNFLVQKKTVFSSPESSKQELFRNQ